MSDDQPPTTDDDGSPPRGRRPSTSRAEVARIALELFERNGFDETTVEDIAVAVGIGRRTVFRYYGSKQDIVWGEFDSELVRLRDHLREAPATEPLMEVLRRAITATNHFGAGELDELRIRIGLITTVPALVAHAAVQYQAWCHVVAAFVASRLDVRSDDLVPQTVARAALGAAMAAFTCWLDGVDENSVCGAAGKSAVELVDELDRALRLLATGFDDRTLAGWRSIGEPPDRGSTRTPLQRDADDNSV